MKTLLYSLSILITLVFLLTNCDEDETSPNVYTIEGEATSQSVCKSSLRSLKHLPILDSISKVSYIFYPDSNVLKLKHFNTGFNCCSGDLYCNIYASGDTIFIEEHETEALCGCNCLFDLDIKISGITSKEYHLKFIEPYAHDLQDLSFTIELSQHTEGEYSVIRKRYPWGVFSE